MKRKIHKNIKSIYPLLIIIASLLMAVGYATVNSVTLDISGEAMVSLPNKVFISSVDISYNADNSNDDNSSATINFADETFLNSTIYLPSDNNQAFITYRVTVYNNTELDYVFEGVEYSIGENTYDNENIIFDELDGLNIGDTLPSKESITFNITFHYKDYKLASSNILNSSINFNFVEKILFAVNGEDSIDMNKQVIYYALNVNNNDGIDYDSFDTSYQITADNNENLKISINDIDLENSGYSATINGGELINDTLTLKIEYDSTNLIPEQEEINLIVKSTNIREETTNIPITVNMKTKTYNITYLLKKSLTSGTISGLGAYSITGTTGTKFKIVEDSGLYINDTSTSLNYWIIFKFVNSNGYSSSLNSEHIYYLSAKNKVLTKYSDASFFRFSLSNYLHSNGEFGIAVTSNNNSAVSSDYKTLSIWGVPAKSNKTTSGSKTYASDYVDSIQIGSSGTHMSESYTKHLMFMDLSAIFGGNNEPPKAWCDKNITYDTTSINYFVGE